MVDDLFVARHGETVLGRAGIVNGDPTLDNPLTDHGIEQARALGDRLRNIDFATCVTTEFPRTRQTADVVLGDRDVPRLVISELNDPPQGDFEQKDFASYEAWMNGTDMFTPVPGGGESQVESLARYAIGWRRVVEESTGPTLVIAHSFPITVAVQLHGGSGRMVRRRYEEEVGFTELFRMERGRLAAGVTVLEKELQQLPRMRS